MKEWFHVFIGKIFLAMFATTASLNVRQWFGNDRKHANYTNGVVFVSLVQTFLCFDIYRLVAIAANIPYYPSKIALVAFYLLLVLLNYWWIVTNGNGKKFISMRKIDTPRQRHIVDISAIAVVILSCTGFFVLARITVAIY